MIYNKSIILYGFSAISLITKDKVCIVITHFDSYNKVCIQGKKLIQGQRKEVALIEKFKLYRENISFKRKLSSEIYNFTSGNRT